MIRRVIAHKNCPYDLESDQDGSVTRILQIGLLTETLFCFIAVAISVSCNENAGHEEQA